MYSARCSTSSRPSTCILGVFRSSEEGLASLWHFYVGLDFNFLYFLRMLQILKEVCRFQILRQVSSHLIPMHISDIFHLWLCQLVAARAGGEEGNFQIVWPLGGSLSWRNPLVHLYRERM